ncbi:hypothetical protein D9615_006545 [Tricholomella constricta]|uniref:ferric-chelate reductase (NADPH) n=1 Tax=Tricholomella constricta TaxID=117010 RepID=A0A8H5HA66_9AGAR|nr:hypothetical protein D9615_006545 [Tricholomella constricta]
MPVDTELNVFSGEEGLRDFYDPDKNIPVPLVELPARLNPFREALNMVLRAQEDGSITPDTHTIVEYSSGSTVISLGIISRIFGIPNVKAFLSNKTSEAKLQLLRFFGLELTLFGGPSQPQHLDPNGGIYAATANGTQPGFYNPDQYTNIENYQAHMRWTGPQIHAQLPGISVIAASMGTAGTMTGTSLYLKKVRPSVTGLGVLTAPGDRVPGPRTYNLLVPVDFPWRDSMDAMEEVDSPSSFEKSLELCRNGLLVGPSSGLALVGVLNFLKKRKDENTLDALRNEAGEIPCVFICCDKPFQYISEYFTKLDPSFFPSIKNEELVATDLYPYNLDWELKPDKAHQMLFPSNGKPFGVTKATFVLDIRDEDSFKSSQIPGSHNLDIGADSLPNPYRDPATLTLLFDTLEARFAATDPVRKSSHSMGNLTEYQMWLKGTPFRNWYTADWDYGLTTIYVFCASIFVFALVNALSMFRSWRLKSRSTTRASASIADRIAGLYRYLSSRQYHVSIFGWYSPPLGAMLIVGALMLFALVFSFTVRPYYWPVPEMGNSPPLGTRTGWISIAIMPFMFAFSSKVNLIGMITGTPHEKLQVFHRWTAWIMYFTSLVHTFPFIQFNIGVGKMELVYATKSYYWTGVAALIPQTWLILMSWGPIRSRYYETFKKLHFLVTIIFMIFLFIHCNFRLTSWDYFWATGGVYGITWLARFGLTLFRNGLGHTASFTLLPDRTVRILIPTKTLRWAPGQHYFVRFLDLGAHAGTSHPFTVASLPDSGALEFHVRVREGITARMAAAAAAGGKTSAVSLDGPYGGVHGSFEVYDRVVLLAGGSGASFTVPILLDLLAGLKAKKVKTKHVHFVWAVPSIESLECYQETLSTALKGVPEGAATVSFYVTGPERSSSPSSGSIEKDDDAKLTGETLGGRPDVGEIVRAACKAEGTVGVAVCGPDGFALDVRNAVAGCELEIACGRKTPCTDIFLHTEAYSW